MAIGSIEMIGTEEITASVANISENIREVRLGWLGRVERKTEEGAVMRTCKIEVDEHQ